MAGSNSVPRVAQMDVSFAPHRPYSALIKNRPRTILQAAFSFRHSGPTGRETSGFSAALNTRSLAARTTWN